MSARATAARARPGPAGGADAPLRVIVTLPPHASFHAEVAAHPLVGGLRLNTVMPLAEEPGAVLARLAALGQPLWIDLKGRQLRVAEAAVPPFTSLRLSHRIRVNTPARALFGNGREEATVLAVDGDRLILDAGPRRVVGPGESVNIPCPSLEVEGVLTERDRTYVAAARALGLHDYMLSFVEGEADLAAVAALDPEARVVAKVESRGGLRWVERTPDPPARLMAARGDLYVELARPHQLLPALRTILARDPEAIAASRICESLARSLEPSSQDITDVAYLLQLGYRTLLLGDELCLRRDAVLAALELLRCIARAEGARTSSGAPLWRDAPVAI